MPLTRRVARCLVPINGRPLVHRTISLLRSAGITDVVIDASQLAPQIEDRLGDGQKLGVTLHYLREMEPAGIPMGLRRARRFLDDEPVAVVNDSVIADLDLADVIACHDELKADATLVLRPCPGNRSHGNLDFDGDISLSALIGEAPDESGFLGPAGIRIFSQRIFDFIPEGTTRSLAETLALMVQAGCHIEGYVMDGYWAELATWETYSQILWHAGRGFIPEST